MGFKKILAYQKGFDLTMDIFHVTKGFPKSEQFVLTSQRIRSSRAASTCYVIKLRALNLATPPSVGGRYPIMRQPSPTPDQPPRPVPGSPAFGSPGRPRHGRTRQPSVAARASRRPPPRRQRWRTRRRRNGRSDRSGSSTASRAAPGSPPPRRACARSRTSDRTGSDRPHQAIWHAP